MTLDQLRIFVSVAEREHMTEAAKMLNIAQSAVSTVVAKLEGDLEVRLFERAGRNVRLTAFGHVFRDRARVLLGHADAFRRWVDDHRRDMRQQASLRGHSASGRSIPVTPCADGDGRAAPRLPIRTPDVAHGPTVPQAGIDELLILLCELSALEMRPVDRAASGGLTPVPPVADRHGPMRRAPGASEIGWV